MSKLKCTKVETLAWDNQQATLQGEDVTVTLRLHNQEDFGTYEQGKDYDLAISKPAKKTPAKKTPAKKTK